MFFIPFIPVLSYIGIHIAAAVIPAIILMRYIYRKDHIEKEPVWLVKKLFIGGFWSALAAMVLETVTTTILDLSYPSPDDTTYYVLMAFLCVAAVEEGTKLFFLYRRSFNDPNFNYFFDAVVYSVAVSLGFAALENVSYVFSFGLSVALPRAVMSVPGHMGFSVVMGVFYGEAKLHDRSGQKGMKFAYILVGYLAAVLLHGFYDACAMAGTGWANVMFFGFIIFMYIFIIGLVRKASRSDRPV